MDEYINRILEKILDELIDILRDSSELSIKDRVFIEKLMEDHDKKGYQKLYMDILRNEEED